MLVLLLNREKQIAHNSTRHRKEKTKGRFGISKVSLKTVVIHLKENCYSTVENLTMKQSIGIPMGKNLKYMIK